MKLYDTTQQPPKPQTDSASQTPEPKPFSYRFKNWWYYHKWYVIGGAALLFFLGNILWHILGIGQKEPDFQIAYIGETVLPNDTIAAVEQTFAELGGDFNGDGEAIVQFNQYTMSFRNSNPGASSAGYASEVLLMSDLSVCDSYFFLTDDPENLQKTYQIFANLDGSCPNDSDVSPEGKVFLWKDCGALADRDLGSYDASIADVKVTGDNLDLLSGLSLGRRCFYPGKEIDCQSQCDELWNRLISTVDR